jgi:hypothetical protein
MVNQFKELMEFKVLTKEDLPKKRRSANSLHIPVIYRGKVRYVADLHFSDHERVYLEDHRGKSVRMSSLILVTKNGKPFNLDKELDKIQAEIDDLQSRWQFLMEKKIYLKHKLTQRFINVKNND